MEESRTHDVILGTSNVPSEQSGRNTPRLIAEGTESDEAHCAERAGEGGDTGDGKSAKHCDASIAEDTADVGREEQAGDRDRQESALHLGVERS
jgi:hypothetical protein